LDDVDDPGADEILDRLHSKAHIRLINSSIPAGIAIIGGLSIIALIKEESISVLGEVQRFMMVIGTFTFYQALLAVIFSILFVIHIASPNRVQQVVEEILEEEEMTGRDIDVGEFIEEYIRLENMLRELYYGSDGINERASAGQMIDYLTSEDILDDLDVDELREITRYRNLVVHGETDSVDREAFDALQDMIEEFQEHRDEMKSRAEV